MKKPEIKKKISAYFVDYDEKILINCIKHRSENLKIHNTFSMWTVIQATNEASTFHK